MVLLSGVWLHGPSNPLRTCRATVVALSDAVA